MELAADKSGRASRDDLNAFPAPGHRPFLWGLSMGWTRRAIIALCWLGASGLANLALAQAVPASVSPDLERASPQAEGMDGTTLVALAHWVRDTPELPIFSILITRHDKLVFELYTGGVDATQAHYMMSVSKSVLSALVGAALKNGAIKSLDTPVSDLLPHSLFASDADVRRFGVIRLREVMGMSALNVSDPPRDRSAAAVKHQSEFLAAPSRVAFALREPLLAWPGHEFLYNDETPILVAGIVQYATGKTLIDFGRTTLFGPLGFVNEEWIHQDKAGIAMGGYGFRMRPVDMQKLGLLYLHGGNWKGQQLLPADWVAKAFAPYMRAKGSLFDNYGWFWWTYDYGRGWRFLVANGWRGQRIAVNREHDLVVTMSAYIEGQNEHDVFEKLMTQYILPAVARGSRGDVQIAVDAALAEVRAGKPRIKAGAESRMIPSASSKARAVPFRPP